MILHPDMVERINAALPPQIRIFGTAHSSMSDRSAVERVLSAFHAKNAIDYRIYEYILPVHAWTPILQNANFQFGPDMLQRINSVLKAYEGAHNYHNFTVGMKASDPSAIRFMRSVTVTFTKTSATHSL